MTGRELTRLVECVPNVSEGRRPEVVDEIVAAFAGAAPEVLGLDRSSDPDHNRTVVTLMGPGPALVEAAVAGAMTRLRGGDDPELDCTDLAELAGRRIAEEAGVPVYLYGAAARHPGWAALPAVRGRGFEALRAGDHVPDFGGPGLHPTAGRPPAEPGSS